MGKKIFSFLLCLCLWVQPLHAEEQGDDIVLAPSAILMEKSTGKILFEKDADTQLAPASVTKIMTMLLIFDGLSAGKISLEDEVTVSEYAASMGGSQVYLEAGEVQSVDTLLKCIAVASANDACVSLAEYLWGSESEFVSRMNERAKGLGMESTHFVNCNGLDSEGHLTTARDIALMSRELITRYPDIRNYCMIWQETIYHTTKKGTSEFVLTNTNKLVRQFEYATGLKTGSTSQAKYCISATGEKEGMELIAVIMGAESSKQRNYEAISLLNYGFAKSSLYEEESGKSVTVKVKGGIQQEVSAVQQELFRYVDTSGGNLSCIQKRWDIPDVVTAPICQGDKIGEAVYYLEDEEIGRVDLVAEETIEAMNYKRALANVLEKFFALASYP